MACAAHTPVTQENDEGEGPSLFQDANFPNYSNYHIETQSEIFYLGPQAQAFVEKFANGYGSDKAQLSALVEGIFGHSTLSLDYSAQANTSADQTFLRRTANCLSLTIMAYSMLKQLDFSPSFNRVDIPEYWTRRDGNTLINEHINIQVMPKVDFITHLMGVRPFIIDFDPVQNIERFAREELSKDQIVASFYVNKSAEAMIEGQFDKAYAYLRAAIALDTTHEGAFLNLGVLYSRSNLVEEAELAYNKALSLRVGYPTALQNLAHLYERTGRQEKAKEIKETLERQRLTNPYYHYAVANMALERGDYEDAIRHYTFSIQLNPRPHEFYFGLARVYSALGDEKSTRRYLLKAQRRTDDEQILARYASKLSFGLSL